MIDHAFPFTERYEFKNRKSPNAIQQVSQLYSLSSITSIPCFTHPLNFDIFLLSAYDIKEVHAPVSVWRSQNSFLESILFFYLYAGSEN